MDPIVERVNYRVYYDGRQSEHIIEYRAETDDWCLELTGITFNSQNICHLLKKGFVRSMKETEINF